MTAPMPSTAAPGPTPCGDWAETTSTLSITSADQVFEAANQGTDTVRTTVSYTLAAGQSMEILRVHNQATTNAINLVGNEVANSMFGNNGVNNIDGKGGADIMRGFLGNDTYVVDNGADKAIELTGQGTDVVRTTVSFALGSNMSIETLQVHNLGTTNAVNLVGNQLANTIIGNNGANAINAGIGNDLLDGNAGKDILTGGTGNDLFRFDTALNAVTNVDRIVDYNVAADTIQLENNIFSTLGVGTLSAGAFHIGASAADANDRIVYNSATGALSYDFNGSAAGGSVQFAKLAAGLAMTNADFLVV